MQKACRHSVDRPLFLFRPLETFFSLKDKAENDEARPLKKKKITREAGQRSDRSKEEEKKREGAAGESYRLLSSFSSFFLVQKKEAILPSRRRVISKRVEEFLLFVSGLSKQRSELTKERRKFEQDLIPEKEKRERGRKKEAERRFFFFFKLSRSVWECNFRTSLSLSVWISLPERRNLLLLFLSSFLSRHYQETFLPLSFLRRFLFPISLLCLFFFLLFFKKWPTSSLSLLVLPCPGGVENFSFLSLASSES